jgi:hypothetical protein
LDEVHQEGEGPHRAVEPTKKKKKEKKKKQLKME